MAMTASKKKTGTCSGTTFSSLICQEIAERRTFPRTTLEVRTTAGQILSTYSLPEQSAGHQVTPDGRLVYALTGGRVSGAGIDRQLFAIDMADGSARDLGASTSAVPAVDGQHVAWFAGDRIIVERHGGGRVLEKVLGELASLHGGAIHAATLLPNGCVAFTRGHRASDKIADLAIISLTDGSVEQSWEIPVHTFSSVFAPAALRADPAGRFLAVPGLHEGLVIVDLQTGEDVADRFQPEQLDLADDRPTLHAHHGYSDIAFDRDGARMAAAYRPGKLSVWTRDGALIRREWVSTNPKARRLVTFDEKGVAFFDSMGTAAHFELDSAA